jgi:hypothetical protein
MFSGNFIWLGHIGLHPYIFGRYLNSSTWNDHWDYIDYTLDYITLYCTVMSSFYHRLTCRSGAVSTRTCSPRAPTAEKKKTKKQPPESIKKVAKGTKYLNMWPWFITYPPTLAWALAGAAPRSRSFACRVASHAEALGLAGANPSFFCCRSAVTTRPRGRSGASQILFSNLVLLPLEDQSVYKGYGSFLWGWAD